mgnify:CR=1 FL=1
MIKNFIFCRESKNKYCSFLFNRLTYLFDHWRFLQQASRKTQITNPSYCLLLPLSWCFLFVVLCSLLVVLSGGSKKRQHSFLDKSSFYLLPSTLYVEREQSGERQLFSITTSVITKHHRQTFHRQQKKINTPSVYNIYSFYLLPFCNFGFALLSKEKRKARVVRHHLSLKKKENFPLVCSRRRPRHRLVQSTRTMDAIISVETNMFLRPSSSIIFFSPNK